MFRAVLSQKKLGPAKIASAFRSQLWISQFNANRIDETHRPVREEDLMRLIGSVQLVPDSKIGARIRLDTDELIGALNWQFGLTLGGDLTIAQCPYCQKWFYTGVGTGKRADAEFCSLDHKIKHFNAKRATSK